MNYRGQSLLQSVSAIAFGALLLAVPALFLNLFGLEPTSPIAAIERLCGLMLLALGATLWSAAEITDRTQQVRVAAGNAMVDVTASALFIASGMSGQLGWLSYVLGGMFAINAITWMLSVRKAD